MSAYGWCFPHATARKRHYILYGRSLCGKWGTFATSGMDPSLSPVPGRDECVKCHRAQVDLHEHSPSPANHKSPFGPGS